MDLVPATDDSPMIGWLGLGGMGLPMAKNARSHGYRVRVYDPRPEAREEASIWGAEPASSVAEVGASCDMVFACLPSLDASKAVASELLGSLTVPRLYVDHSTLAPVDVRAIGKQASAANVMFLDAPVSGHKEARDAGELAIMVGGAVEALDLARPVFETYGKRIFHMGELGAGCVTKLTHNIIGITTALTAMQALLLGVRNGVAMDKLAEAVMAGAAGNSPVPRIAAQHASRAYRHSKWPDIAMRLALKDVQLGLEMAEASNWLLDTTFAAEATWRAASDGGYGERELFSMIDFLESRADPVAAPLGSEAG